MDRIEKAMLTILVLALIAMPCFTIFSVKMESETYNRLTHAQTTWWDALWVELRVQDAPR